MSICRYIDMQACNYADQAIVSITIVRTRSVVRASFEPRILRKNMYSSLGLGPFTAELIGQVRFGSMYICKSCKTIMNFMV